MKVFGDRLKEARLSCGFTQDELAKRTGTVKATISSYELGKTEPDMYRISQFISVLGVDANFLFRDEMAAVSQIPVTSDEQELLEKYRTLDDHGKRVVDFLLNEEAARVAASKEQGHKHLTDEKAIALSSQRYGSIRRLSSDQDQEESG